MDARFDILRVVNGTPVFVETVSTLDLAESRVQQLMLTDRCEYLIHSSITGNQLSIKPE